MGRGKGDKSNIAIDWPYTIPRRNKDEPVPNVGSRPVQGRGGAAQGVGKRGRPRQSGASRESRLTNFGTRSDSRTARNGTTILEIHSQFP